MQGVSSICVRPRLGVDLGTLVTVAVRASQSDATSAISSAVALGNEGYVVGEQAEQVLAAQPARGTRQLKRRFGDTTPIVLDGDAIQPDALVGALLRAVVADSGIDTSSATLVLTHPASWRGYKLELLRTIGASLGFVDVELMGEPVAAASRYASAGRISTGDTVAVYDLGGTFDAAIVSLSESGPSLVGTPQSLERFGGAEIDQLVFEHVAIALGGALEQLDRKDDEVRHAVAVLRSACTAAKHELSTKSEASVSVVMPGLDTSVRVTRDELETALRPYITETLQAVDRAIAAAGMTPNDLAGVILSGGGSRIPLVAEMVAGHLGRPVLNDFDSKLVVASGAAETIATRSSQPFNSIADTASASPRGPIMSDHTTPPAGSAPAAPAGGRSTPPPPPAASKRGSSKAAKLAGGAAAAAAAVAAGVMYGDDVVDAASGGDDPDAGAAGRAGQPGSADDEAGDRRFETADRLERESTDDDSMDAFDAAEPSDAGDVAEPVAGPLGTPLVEAASAGSPPNEPAPRQAHRAEPESAPGGGDAVQQPATGAPGAHRPASAQTIGDDGGPADAPSATPASVASQPGAPVAQAAPPSVDAEFETARATLLERLEHFEAPAGTSPEDAQQLRQELIDAVERFDPAPGQTTQEALTELRDDYDRRVQDFTQDQKIDALIQEAQRDNETETATPVDSETPLAVPVDAAVEDEAEGSADGVSSVDPASDEPTDADATGEGLTSESFVPTVDPFDPTEVGTTELGTTELGTTELGTTELVDLAETIDLDADALADASDTSAPDDLDIEVDPASILIGLDQPADGGLKDDFDLMIAEPGSKSELDTSDIDVPVGRSLDMNVDDDGLATQQQITDVGGQQITDVRATYVPPTEQPVLLADVPADVSSAAPIDAAIDSPIHFADDVLGDVSVASMVGRAEPAVVDLGEPIVVDGTEIVAGLIETEQAVEIVAVVVEPIVELEPIPAPFDDLVLEETDFAADIASDITPAAPDSLSFEP